MNRRFFLKSALTLTAVAGLSRFSLVDALARSNSQAQGGRAAAHLPFTKVVKTDAEWKRLLTPEQYYVTRQKGTEAPYSSPLNDIHEKGTFECVSCSLPLFS